MRIMGFILASLAGLWFIGAPFEGVSLIGSQIVGSGVAWAADPVPAPTDPASAQSPGTSSQGTSSLGSFGDWRAKTVAQQGMTLCYITSTPSKDSPIFRDRGSTGFLVTHAENGKARDQVSVALGFTPRSGTAVSLKIGKRSFTLQKIQGERAWSSSDTQDRQIVAAMKNGDTLLLRATTQQGQTGEDRYSLDGFKAAYDKIADACGL